MDPVPLEPEPKDDILLNAIQQSHVFSETNLPLECVAKQSSNEFAPSQSKNVPGLVLTADEFAKLTSSKSNQPTKKHGVANIMAQMKKQQRLIKNRESSKLSREKKQQYLITLEKNVQALQQENIRLQMENSQLKTQVGLLSTENKKLNDQN